MNCNTQKGVYFLIIGMIITMICSFVTSIFYFFTQNSVVSMSISIFGFVSFIGVILIIIGAIFFLLGRREFGEKHQKNITNAVVVFIINIVIMFFISFIIGFMAYFSAVSTLSAGDSFTTLPEPSLILIVVMFIVSAVMGGLIYYFALIELENELGKKILYLGIFSSIVISIITSFYLAGMLGELFGSISTGNSYSSFTFTQNVGKIGILGIISSLLYIYSIYIPYNRIKNGELIPIISSSGKGTFSNRICPNCGRQIPFDANVCPYCGKKFEIYL